MSEQGHTNSPDPSNRPVVLLESIVDIAKTHVQESDEGINDMLALDYGGITYSGHSIRVDAYSGCDMKDRYVSMHEIIGGTQVEGRKGKGRGEAHGIVGTGICGGCVRTEGL